MSKTMQSPSFGAEHFRLAMEASNIGMWDWDVFQDQIVLNDMCKAILGLQEDTINYQLFLSLLYPDERERIDSIIMKSLEAKRDYNVEFRIIRPDGELRWIMARGRGMYDAEGKVVRMIGVALDITEKKSAEEKQREADKRISSILERIPSGFWHLDKNWRCVYINAQAERMSGYAREEVQGKFFWDIYPEFIGSMTQSHLRRVRETQQPVGFELYYKPRNIWFEIHAYPSIDDSLSIYVDDITARKQLEEERTRLLENERAARIEAESAHQRSEELVKQLEAEHVQLQAIMDQAPSGIVIAEVPSGKLILFNEEASRILGQPLMTSDSYHEYEHYRLMHADGTFYEAEEYPLTRAILHGETVKQEVMRYKRGDGSIIYLAVNAAPICDKDRTIAAVTTFQDVSQREELERKKDEFVSMASHELRSPLTGMKGHLQLAERRLQKLLGKTELLAFEDVLGHIKKVMECVSRAIQQANLQDRLINDLLDVTRIQTGKLKLLIERHNLVSIVISVVEDQRTVTPTRIIELELPAQTEIFVMVDRVRIEQAVSNYLTNAIKYSAESEPIIVGISLEEGFVRVWVKDNGLGLSQEARQRIWDRFYQVPGVREHKGSQEVGLGLGLSITQSLIQQHGGTVGVESELGKGSTFWFTLPLA